MMGMGVMMGMVLVVCRKDDGGKCIQVRSLFQRFCVFVGT